MGDEHDQTMLEGDPDTVLEAPCCFTRGLNPRAALAWARQAHGDDAMNAVLAALDGEDRATLMSAGHRTWIPFLTHARLLVAIDGVLGRGDLALLPHVGRAMASHDLPVVARPFMRLASPGFFVDKAMRVWGLYHSHGRWERKRTAGLLQAVLVDHPEHHPAFCATFVGWMEGALSLTGAIDPIVHEVRCAARGASGCSFEATWLDAEGPQRTRVPRAPS